MRINKYRVTMRIGNDTATTSTIIEATCEGNAAAKATEIWDVKEIIKIKKVK